MWSRETLDLIDLAAREDLSVAGDLTAGLLADPAEPIVARLVPRATGVLCGLALAPFICRRFDARLEFAPEPGQRDGGAARAGAAAGTLRGPRAAVLSVERTLLNFLGRMSGVATLARRYVDAARAADPRVQVFDTRKTIPGWRELDKYAVRCGGGSNHRAGLYDAVLVKDNHLAGVPVERLAGALFEMLHRVATVNAGGGAADGGTGRASRPQVIVEVDTLEQLEQVFKVVGVDVVMLDNFAPGDLRRAAARRDDLGLRGRVLLEASGGVTLETIADVAAAGVERISVGAITHSAASLDVGLDF